jgi:beta-glucanase (GH16 family)
VNRQIVVLTGVAFLGLGGAGAGSVQGQPPTPAVEPAAAATGGSPWRLLWSDEFDKPGLPDAAKWAYQTGGDGWGNRELQVYTEGRPENARVENGHLIITAQHEMWAGRDYTSARLVTAGRQSWTYGYFEIRAKLPCGRGTWPAIWMLGEGWQKGNWPAIGEIDIMEHVGHDTARSTARSTTTSSATRRARRSGSPTPPRPSTSTPCSGTRTGSRP